MISADEGTNEGLFQETIEDITVQAFRPEELNSCPACSRRNAPDKPRCMYCGAELEIGSGVLIRLSERRLESWEKGFTTIVTGGRLAGEADQLAGELSLEPTIVDAISKGSIGLPLRRAETRAEAEFIQRRLATAGIDSTVVADEDLKLNTAPVRIRGLEVYDGAMELRLFNSDTTRMILIDKVAIVVVGNIIESKTQSTEKRSRREAKVLDESQGSSKETVIDIYSKDDPIGFRIYPRGFDFSTLGPDKSLLAAENIRMLAERLRSIVGKDRFSVEYDQMREMLDTVWELETRKESLGLQKSGFGRPGLGRAATISNAEQFTRYSRMRRHLL